MFQNLRSWQSRASWVVLLINEQVLSVRTVGWTRDFTHFLLDCECDCRHSRFWDFWQRAKRVSILACKKSDAGRIRLQIYLLGNDSGQCYRCNFTTILLFLDDNTIVMKIWISSGWTKPWQKFMTVNCTSTNYRTSNFPTKSLIYEKIR